MAEAPPKDGFGVKKASGPSAVPPAAPAPEKTMQGSLLHETHQHGLHKGKQEGYGKGFFHGTSLAFVSIAVAFVFVILWGKYTDNDERAKRFLAVREAEHLATIKAEDQEKRFPVVEDAKGSR